MAAGCNIGAHDIIFTLNCQRKNKNFNALPKIRALFGALRVPASTAVHFADLCIRMNNPNRNLF
jgi:hypothetical protein